VKVDTSPFNTVLDNNQEVAKVKNTPNIATPSTDPVEINPAR